MYDMLNIEERMKHLLIGGNAPPRDIYSCLLFWLPLGMGQMDGEFMIIQCIYASILY